MGDIPQQRTGEPAELMARAATGNRDAFAALYRSYEMVVLRYVRRRVGSWHVADDIAAATWVRALANVRWWVEKGRDPGAWLVTIARNLVHDYFKSARHRTELLVGDMPDDAVVSELDPADREQVRELYRAIGLLSKPQRTAVLLRLNGLTVAQTARAMGRSEGSVKALEHRAKRALRRELAGSPS